MMIVMIVLYHYSGFWYSSIQSTFKVGNTICGSEHSGRTQLPPNRTAAQADTQVTTFLGGTNGAQVCCIFY